MGEERPPSISYNEASSQVETTSTNKLSPAQAAARESTDQPQMTKTEYEALAAFRYALRRFLRFSEQTAREAGITPQQHQVLLAIKGFPGRESATISELAERLQMRQHSMVGLIDRIEAQGLVRREPGTADRRQVYVALTPAGETLLHKLALTNRKELRGMREALQPVLWDDSPR
ncbi:MAG TPA: MarR family winged helix-turn-helix transcriptional regulator [Ktedonobacterales bacterium]|nr:MarR family winged helix-turn-helix transcriptional regulator [Ktedonobacterales bacterium]